MNDIPTLQDRLAGLSPEKRALAMQRLRERTAATRPAPSDTAAPIARADRTKPLPLSFAQQQLWLAHELEGPTATYNVAVAVRLAGALNRAALESALTEIVRRHEPLRTRFVRSADGIRQHVCEPDTQAALLALEQAADPVAARERATSLGQRPFDLEPDLPLRATLIATRADEHLLVLVLHHIAADGWAMGLLVGELATLYRAFAAGSPSPLADLPARYADYAAWEHTTLDDAAFRPMLDRQRQTLQDCPPGLDLLPDRPRPPEVTHRGATLRFPVDAATIGGLRTLAEAEGATLFMAALAVLDVLLARYTGQDDIVIGCPLANRRRPEAQAMIGYFVNTLPVRLDLSGEPSFREVLRRARAAALGAIEDQALPLGKLVGALPIERDRSRSPLFQVVLAYQAGGAPSLAMPGLEASLVDLDLGTAKFELTFIIEEAEGGWRCSIEYNTDLFNEATIARLGSHLRRLIEAAIAQPDRPVASLDLLSPGERATILGEWAGRRSDYPRDASVAALFEAEAARRPDAPALLFGDAVLSYGELNQRANRVAHKLRGRGVVTGMPVGLAAPRSFDLLVGMLGILKAGGAYVPLDQSYPDERLRLMVRDSGLSLILTGGDWLTELASDCVALDIAQASADGRDDNPPTAATGDDVAYIMYTSGSTGEPKGSRIPHRAIMRLVRNTDFVTLDERETLLLLAPVSFDASTLEIWGALLNGGHLAIAPPEPPTPAEIGALIHRHGVTTMWLTAGVFHLMVEERLDDLRPLRQLLAGGDALSLPHTLRAARALAPGRVINGYGPTENTTFTCCHTIDLDRDYGTSIPIGRPIANTSVYILDTHLEPVPVGVAGELYTGGDGLAIDYLNRPELTAERFIANPFGPGRLYCTGDRVRWLPDGTIEFLGRADQQVKIRGFRVEPAEIEVALLRNPELRDAIVVVDEAPATTGGRAGKQLVAYLVPTDPSAVDEPGLTGRARAALRRHLPEYMMPAAFVALAALPLTANGKVDRRALPAPRLAEPVSAAPAPASPVETALAAIYCEVLGLDAIDGSGSFFALGGNSLSAMQLVSRIEARLGVVLSLRQVFATPEIAGLAQAIAAMPRSGQQLDPIPLADRNHPLPLSFAQERLWFLHRLEPDNPFYNIAIALRIEGPLSLDALDKALRAVARRHEILRTTYHEASGHPVQRICDDAGIALATIDARGASEAVIEERARNEARLPFDLQHGPMVRATVLVHGADRHVLLLTMHHIAADGWSMGVLVRELAAAYAAHARDTTATLPSLPLQYADFAAWQRQAIDGAVYAEQLTYWQRQLADYPAELTLPTDRPRAAVQAFRGGSVRFTIDAATTHGLNALARECDATLFMVLLTAFGVLLSRHAGQSDLVVGTPIANRRRPEIEPLVGFFVNTLALRLDLAGNPTARDMLGRVRQLTLDAYANQDLPFERLVDELGAERDLSRNPLFQVMFALQNAPLDDVHLPGVAIDVLDIERSSAQFDLVLDMWERPEGLLGVLEFSSDLFDRDRIARMVEHFRTLLAALVAEPGQNLSALPLLPEPERRLLLDGFNNNRAAFPIDRTLHALFEDQVTAGPERIAAEHGNTRVTYAELNARANRIAHRLRRLGLGRNQFAALLLDRGIDFLAAILGILKAGGAYVPVDPTYPTDRIEYMLENSAAGIVVTSRALAERATGDGRTCLFLDDDLSDEPADNLAAVNTPQDRAYMLYTSGSTGLPKGAILRHDGKINHIYGQFDWLKLDRDTAFLQSAPASSDISVWQFLGPVLLGGRTVIADWETVCEPRALWELIANSGVTIIELVPVVMSALLEYTAKLPAEQRQAHRLQWAMATGEAVSPALVNQWLAQFPQVPVVNAYGPTEAADDVCQFVLTEPLMPNARGVPVGTPLANLALYVLDEGLSLVPVGVAGEICVSGIGVGEGYWGDEARTRDRFVPNPYAANGRGEVLYRTGDRGVWRSDGVLECLSRLDEQVKLRGFRIELGEIEAVLGRHPAVRDAAVLAHAGDDGADARLVAYLAPNRTAAEVTAALDRAREEQVALWNDLHDREYRQTLDYGDPTFNVIGWDSTYDNQPLPIEEMREYVDGTTQRILSLQPRSLLEIGCGTGLIMFPLLRHLQRYTGTDLSQSAIDHLTTLQTSDAVRSRFPDIEHAKLRQSRADALGWLEPGLIDTVIFPSVVQYFPSAEYLLSVLDGLMQTVAPGGSIFFGDVRSLPLLDLFHASIELFKAEDDLPAGELVERIRQRGEIEQELALAPEFFTALRRRYPRLAAVEVLPKQGTRHNEMTRFRYDVVLRLDRAEQAPAVDWHVWDATPGGTAALAAMLAKERPEAIAFRNIPNARITTETGLTRLLSSRVRATTVSDLRTTLAGFDDIGVEPEHLKSLAAAAGYQAHFSIARSGREGRFDAVFTRGAERPAFLEPECAAPITSYANNPLQERLARSLTGPLREYLRDRLPHYMVPADFAVLDNLPTTPAGKVDRRALVPPRRTAFVDAQDYIAPRSDSEKALAEIWSEVLGIERCGIRQNFFAAGGHSLKATQVVSHIARRLGVEVPLRSIFSHPTIEELATQIAGHSAPAQRIERVPDAPHYPLSHAQRRLWILAQIEAGSVAYNMPASIRLDGALDVAALREALTACVARHEALRTTFAMVGGEPRQFVHPATPLLLSIIDLASEPDPAEAARAAALHDAAQPFDLTTGPLVRFSLLQLGGEQHVLLVNVHHIVCDDWSIGVLIRDMMRAYGGIALPPLRVQYRDYAAWERERLDGAAMQAYRAYWLDRFADEIPVLDLPADFPRPPVKTYNGGNIAFSVPGPELRQLQALAHQSGATLFMLLVAAVKVLLFRYTGQRDLTVAAPVAGREHPDLEHQVGFYVNSLALRDEVDPDRPFRDFLTEVARNTTAALEHQAYPFDRLVDELAPRRDPSRLPLADVVVVMQDSEAPELALPGLAVGEFVGDYGASKYDVHFAFQERGGVLQAALVYNTDLFATDRIERMRDHLLTLLRGIATTPDRAVGRLPLLPPAERRQVLEAFNPAPATAAKPRTLIELFGAQAASHSQREAVSFRPEAFGGDRQSLTYGELDAAATRLAHRLREAGVGPDKLVGLFVERSLDAVIGIIAILKAGGAYVPIDPNYPQERTAFMTADAGLQAIVSQQPLRDRLGPLDVPVLFTEDTGTAVAPPLPPAGITPDSIAYVIYTSGSTGQPKGVAVTHANATRLFDATRHWFAFGETDVWTLFHSIAFDFSVWEIWGALLHGGRLVIVPQAVTRWPEAFHALLAEERVTVLNQTPSAFRALIAADEHSETARDLALRLVIFGGEALDMGMLRPWFARHGDCTPQLVNMYGITETTVHVTYRPLGTVDLDRPASCIGEPIPDLRLHILDAYGEPVPIGVPGEIHVGGAGVARGYLNRPELTAERFIADPFSGGRLYRSGDLGRYRVDGDIEYLGRIDQQVKIRGFRIELGEIEAALTGHPAVNQALVLADTPGSEPRLVAYVVTNAGGIAAELRTHLRERLPDYMVPAAIVPIAGFTMTAHGKIDRAALPDWRATASDAAPSDEPPGSEMEIIVASIVRDMLGNDRVRLDDNFFDVGADSLMLVRAHSRLQERLTRRFSLVALYQYPTVRALAAFLAPAEAAASEDSALDEAATRGARRRAALGASRRGRAAPGVAAGAADG